jgi:hypothetical protein
MALISIVEGFSCKQCTASAATLKSKETSGCANYSIAPNTASKCDIAKLLFFYRQTSDASSGSTACGAAARLP